jgi:hypothetical protein
LSGLARALFAAGLVLTAVAAPAAVVTLGAGDSALFRFDFSAQTPPPPYAPAIFGNGSFAIDLDGMQPGEFVSIAWYDSGDGLGTPIATTRGGANSGIRTTFSSSSFGVGLSGILDGLFSARVMAEGGAFDLVSVTANLGATSATNPEIAAQTVILEPAAPVPEPGSLVCAALGLAALAGRGRRRAQPHGPCEGR